MYWLVILIIAQRTLEPQHLLLWLDASSRLITDGEIGDYDPVTARDEGPHIHTFWIRFNFPFVMVILRASHPS